MEDMAENVEALKARSTTPGAFFLETCDGKFTDEDLNEEGNAFTPTYFDFEKGSYLDDYCEILGAGTDIYHVADSWENFDLLKPVVDKRFAEWKEQRG